MSVLIKGGRVVTAADDYVADVLVDGERVTLIGESLDVDADRVIDAHGQVPAAGLRRPAHPSRHAVRRHDDDRRRRVGADGRRVRRHDDPRRLLHPGPGPDASPTRSPTGARRLTGKQLIDMGYHIAVTDLGWEGALDELAPLPDQGVTSYKLFMAYKGALMVDDETLFRTMEVAAATGALVMVHAENGDAIDVLVKKALAEGHTEPLWHALTRPPETEGEATNRAIQLAHVAGSPALRRPRLLPGVGRADRRRPARRAGTSGARPARSTSSSTRRSWSGRTSRAPSTSTRRRRATRRTRRCSGTPCAPTCCSAISTDHCAFRWDGQKTLGRDDFSKIPNGGPGLENRLQMIHHFGVRRGPDHAQPDGRAARDEPREAVRPLSAQGHARRRLRRRHRRLRPGAARHDLRRRPTTRGSTTTSTRAPRWSARPRSCCCAATSWSRTASWWPRRGSASSSPAPSSARSFPAPAEPSQRQPG